jgi:hypothetical protein
MRLSSSRAITVTLRVRVATALTSCRQSSTFHAAVKTLVVALAVVLPLLGCGGTTANDAAEPTTG